MHFAIFSDLHDNTAALRVLLRRAEQQGVDRLIFLGDAVRDRTLLHLLRERTLACTFGNWEVSGLASLRQAEAAWVSQWPATVRLDSALCCHATPEMPAAAATTAAAAVYRIQQGLGWRQLFPDLYDDAHARWLALAALEAADLRVAFHGHTHRQAVWSWTAADGAVVGDAAAPAAGGPQRELKRCEQLGAMSLNAGIAALPNRYLVGVGSAGQPEDGPAPRYVLYDDRMHVVTMCALPDS